MGNPLLTIITAVYNGADCINTAIDSVAALDYDNVEYIIQDGDSNDGTVEILKDREQEIPGGWVSEPDKGVYDALNRAVQRAKGNWVLILGADDKVRNVFHELIPRFGDPKGLYYGDVWLPHAAKRHAGRFGRNRLARTNISQQAILYPRHVFDDMKFDLRYPIQADWLFNMQCLAREDCVFHYVDEIIADFEDQGGLSSSHADDAFNRDYLGMVKQYFPWRVWVERAAILGTGRLLRKAGLIR